MGVRTRDELAELVEALLTAVDEAAAYGREVAEGDPVRGMCRSWLSLDGRLIELRRAYSLPAPARGDDGLDAMLTALEDRESAPRRPLRALA